MRVIALTILYYGSAAYATVNPLYGVLFFVHIMLMRPENLTWGSPIFGRLHLITAVATLVGYLLQRARYSAQGTTSNHQKNNVIVFSVFVLWLVISSAFAEHSQEASFELTVVILKILVFCFLFAQIVSQTDQLRLYIWVSSISIGLLSFWGVAQGLTGNYRLEELWGVGGSNVLGALLVLMAPFIFANAIDSSVSRTSRLIFLACAVFTVLCCFYTDSRGAFLGLCVGMLIFLVQVKRRVQFLGALIVVAILVSPWLPDTYIDRVATIFSSKEQRDLSAAARPVLWEIAFRIWQDHPVAGVGLGNYSAVKETYAGKVADIVQTQDLAEMIFDQPRVPHSLYFSLLAETGAVGLILFLLLFARNVFLRPPYRDKNESGLYYQIVGAQAGLIGFAVSSLFGDFYYIEPLYFQLFWVGAAHGTFKSKNEKLPLPPEALNPSTLTASEQRFLVGT